MHYQQPQKAWKKKKKKGRPKTAVSWKKAKPKYKKSRPWVNWNAIRDEIADNEIVEGEGEEEDERVDPS